MSLVEKLVDKSKSAVVGLALATTLAYSSLGAQNTPTKIPIENNSWNATVPIEQVYRPQTGGFAAEMMAKLNAKKSSSNVYFSGRIKDDYLEIAYSVTDPQKPSRASPEINSTETQLYLYVPNETTARTVEEQACVYEGSSDKITYRDLKSREDTNGLVFGIGKDLVANTIEADPSRTAIKKLSFGLVNLGCVEEFNNAMLRMYEKLGENFDKSSRQGVDILRVNSGILDDNDVSQLTEIGRMLKIKLNSNKSEIPISACLRITTTRNKNIQNSTYDSDSVEMYTAPIMVPTTINSETNQVIDNNDGFDETWIIGDKNEEGSRGLVVDKKRVIYFKTLNPSAYTYIREVDSNNSQIIAKDAFGREYDLGALKSNENGIITFEGHGEKRDFIIKRPNSYFGEIKRQPCPE